MNTVLDFCMYCIQYSLLLHNNNFTVLGEPKMREFSVFTKTASIVHEGAKSLSQALCSGVVQNPRSFSSIAAANP